MSIEEKENNEQPEVYALSQDKSGWQFNRRTFLAASGAAAAALAAAGCGLVEPKPTVTPVPTDTATPQPTPTQTPTPQPTLGQEELGDMCFITSAHASTVTALAISPDGALLATGAKDGTLKLWSFPDGQLITVIETMERPVQSLAFSPDGALLAAAYPGEDTIRLWAVPDGALLMELYNQSSYSPVTFSPDGSMLISSGITGMLLWSIPDGELIQTVNVPEEMLAFALSPDGHMLAGGSRERILIWAYPEWVELGQVMLEEEVTGLSIRPDGSMLVCQTEAGPASLWYLPEGGMVDTIDDVTGGFFTLFTPDGEYLVLHTAAENGVRFKALAGLQDVDVLDLHNQLQFSAIFSPDGKYLVIGGDRGSITIWSYPEKQLLGCVIDLDATTNGASGIAYQTTDSQGQTVTYTLPCGSPLPAGAVCTCNCVAGYGCGCVGHSPSCSCVGNSPACSCVSYTAPCSCNSHSSGGHYWYPN